MSPPGTTTLVHENLHSRDTWDPYGHAGWYVRPEMIYYRCLTSYISKTAKERVFDTTEFPPSTITLPKIYSKDAEKHAADDLPHTLLNPTPTIPLTVLGDKKTAALRNLAEIFTKAALPQETPPPVVHTAEATSDADPAPPPRVDPQGDISLKPGRAPI